MKNRKHHAKDERTFNLDYSGEHDESLRFKESPFEYWSLRSTCKVTGVYQGARNE